MATHRNNVAPRMIKLCPQQELPEGHSRGFRLHDTSIFALRSQQRIYAYYNRCPHLGIELEWVKDQFLSSDATLIQCSTHGALFLIETGLCVAGPCQGERLQAIPARIEDGYIVIAALTDAPAN